MTDHREKGSGSLFYRARDDRWVAQVEAGFTPAGNRRHITKSARTKAEAKTLLRQMQNDARRGRLAPPSNSLTVKAWAARWLPLHRENVRPTTFTDARGVVRRYIVPAIGKRKLAQLTPGDVRAVHEACREAGFGESTTLRAHNVLMVMLKAAEVEGHTVPGNVRLTKRPQPPESDRDAIPLADALGLLREAAGRPDAARWVAALLQGMRQGECLGLTWQCVDLDAGTLDVSWQLQRLPYADRDAGTFRMPRNYTAKRLDGAAHLVRPKSSAGRRVIPLVPWMREALQQWRDAAPANPYDLVWVEDGRPIRKTTDRAGWFALQDAAQVAHVDGSEGRRFTLHEARHTTATLLLEAGVDPRVIQAIVGHSSMVATRGYQHVSQALARQALNAVADRLQLADPYTPTTHITTGDIT